MNLSRKNDTQLLADLTSLRTREKAVIAELLYHLREVDRRNIHLEKGHSSMHAQAQSVFRREEQRRAKENSEPLTIQQNVLVIQTLECQPSRQSDRRFVE